jgi:D-hydroxyproline dehydrogenase
MADAEIDVAVVGAGIIGLATALALQLERRRVVLIDKNEPAQGCSWGNAGILCCSEMLPLASIETLAQVPRMLLDPLGPLAIRPRHALKLLPWLARFARNAAPAAVAHATNAIAALNTRSITAYRALLEASDAQHLLIERGMLKILADSAAARKLGPEIRANRQSGGVAQMLTAGQVGELEPALAHACVGAIFYPGVAHVSDPYAVAHAFLTRLIRGGARVVQTEVRSVRADERGCRIATVSGELRACRVVISAGVWSKALIEPFGLRAPVVAARGYHLCLPRPGVTLTRPLYFHRESFVATALASGLRLAGTAEFAAATAAADWRRAEGLLSLARRYLPALAGADATRWMGSRPCFPDSMPALGQVRQAPRVFYAFGHQHLGLTQAAITGICMAAMMSGRTPPVDLTPFSLERFGRP